MKTLIGLLLVSVSVSAQTALEVNGATLNLAQSTVVQIAPRVVAGAQPTADDLAKLAVAGVKVVIDLRGTQEDRGFNETGISQQLGLRYINMPISGPADITFENAKKLDALLTEFAADTVLLHCHSGNRVGALLALREALHGADKERALSIGKTAGLKSLESAVRTLLDTQ